jgi:hypothetical protein
VRIKVALFLALLLLGACNATVAPSPSPLGACALVPNMDALVGKTALGAPGGFTLNDVNRCIWTYAVDPSRWVTVSVASKTAYDDAIDAFGDGEQVAGLGADALWWAANDVLSVDTGDAALQVDLELDEEDASRDLAVNIARAALDNLT